MSEAPSTLAATPAERIIQRYGVKRLAAWTGRHPSRVHAWAWAPDKGGTGGVIPHPVRPKIIAGAARELGETVTYPEFEPQGEERYLHGAGDPAVLAEARAQ